MKVNGEDVQVHYGDELVPLPTRLSAMERKVKRLEAAIVVALGILVLHALGTPLEDLMPFLLNLIGL